MAQLRWTAPEGDKTLHWSADDSKAIAKVKKKFAALKAEGYNFYRVDHVTVERKGEPIDEFDPSLEEIFAVAPFAAG